MSNVDKLKVTSRLIYKELVARGIDVSIVSAEMSWMRYRDYQGVWHDLRSTLSDREYAISYVVASNKYITMEVCKRLNIPHPRTVIADNHNAELLLRSCGKIVIKPLEAAHGKGISVGITKSIDLTNAIKIANEFSNIILAQQHVEGADYRLLYINNKYVAAIRREPAMVCGNGVNTIKELIQNENQNPDRGVNYEKALEVISMEEARHYLGESLDIKIPKKDERVQVVGVANLGSGGNAKDVTCEIPELMKEYAQTIVDELRMGICGVDFLWTGKEADEPQLIEINATPGIDMHDDPLFGTPRNVIKKFVDYILS